MVEEVRPVLPVADQAPLEVGGFALTTFAIAAWYWGAPAPVGRPGSPLPRREEV